MDALRVAMKEFLKDLHREWKRAAALDAPKPKPARKPRASEAPHTEAAE
jgi:hypothetical protein